ncbi:MAG: aromatic hydrocarbon degradation protein [Chitinophagaceae bacterium]
MKFRLTLLILLSVTANQLWAQVPEDAIRMSWTAPSGTARNQGIGGAGGSLGGELTTLFINPAGLGFYKVPEFVMSPGLSLTKSKGDFRGNSTTSDMQSRFSLGATGFVLPLNSYNPRWKSQVFSIGVNRTANFNSSVHYSGQNDYSSFSEAFAEEFAASGLPIDVDLGNASLTLGTKLAAYTYLIDTLKVNGAYEIVGAPQHDAILANKDALLNQERTITSKGGITEVAIGYGANLEDKFFIGGSIGIPIVNYTRSSLFRESDAGNATDKYFDYATYQVDYKASGAGVNAKLGVIFKPTNLLRVGIAIHSPTVYGLKETTTERIENRVKNLHSPGYTVYSATSQDLGYSVPTYRYDLVSPWKFIVSGSYIFGEVADVTKQKGFVTADIEYVTHRSSKFNSANEDDDDSYYKAVNQVVKDSYKGAFNFRVGGEMKFNTFMGRLGFAYYGNPVKDKELKVSRMNLTGGLGYRNKGIFFDIAYVYSIVKDTDFPYRLYDKANTFASIKNNASTVVMTVGFKM